MAKVNLSLKTLGDLDGGMVQAITDAAIQEAIDDLEDRGQDGKPRHVVIDLILTMDGRTQAPIAEVAVAAKLPPRRSGGTVAEQRHTTDGKALSFQSLNPTRPDQPTFDEFDGETKKDEADGE